MAFSSDFREFIFFISTLTPSSSESSSATDIFASKRKFPFSNLPFDIPKSITNCLSSSMYATAIFAEDIIGLVTTSTSGTPDLLKSSSVLVAESILPDPK